jgi:hypothetical protein
MAFEERKVDKTYLALVCGHLQRGAVSVLEEEQQDGKEEADQATSDGWYLVDLPIGKGEPRTPNPKTPNPKPRNPKPKPRNPEPRNPEPRTPNPKTPNPETPNPEPRTPHTCALV